MEFPAIGHPWALRRQGDKSQGGGKGTGNPVGKRLHKSS